MTGRQKYGQGCPVSHALDLVGDRWALLVVRELRLGPRRFGDLATALPGIAPSVLTQRLGDLVEVGVLERVVLPRPHQVEGYRLTTWGADLEPVFVALARWGARSPIVPLAGPISDDAVMLGIRTFFPPVGSPADAKDAAAPKMSGTVLVSLQHDRYLLQLTGGALQSLVRLAPGELFRSDAAVHADADTLRSLLVGIASPATVLTSGKVTLAGDEDLARHLLDAIVRRR